MIYVDLDGVIANFGKGALRLVGREDQINWYDVESHTRVLETLGMSTEQFWALVSMNSIEFYSNLEPYAWTDRLLDGLIEIAEVRLLTACGSHPASAYGKGLWVQKNRPDLLRKMIMVTDSRMKSACAATGVLIDDSRANILDWRKQGAIAYEFDHRHAHNKSDYIDNLLDWARITYPQEADDG